MPRKKLTLPDDEVRHLRALNATPSRLRARVCELYAEGWPLSAIAEALDPPRPRSTVHFWVTSSPPSSSDSDSPIPAAEKTRSSRSPRSPRPPRPTRVARDKSRRTFDPREPRLSPTEAQSLAVLAPLARRYRSRANPLGEYARANDELTRLCKAHYTDGVSITELARAAGVTYKAMERRVFS